MKAAPRSLVYVYVLDVCTYTKICPCWGVWSASDTVRLCRSLSPKPSIVEGESIQRVDWQRCNRMGTYHTSMHVQVLRGQQVNVWIMIVHIRAKIRRGPISTRSTTRMTRQRTHNEKMYSDRPSAFLYVRLKLEWFDSVLDPSPSLTLSSVLAASSYRRHPQIPDHSTGIGE